MTKFIVGIDTSHQKKYSGMVSGTEAEVYRVHTKLAQIFSKLGQREPLHWSRMQSRIRKGAEREVCDVIKNCRLNFNVFEHPLPRDAEKKTFYLYDVPNIMSSRLESWLRGREGVAVISVDDDYHVSNVGIGTDRFVERFLHNLCFRLVGIVVTLRKDGVFRASIRHYNGKKMELIALKVASRDSREVQIIDVVLGYYLNNPKNLESKNVYFKKI